MHDTEQIRRIRDGNERAFEELFRHYGQALVHFAHNYVRDLSIAENLVQDVFVAVWENRATLNPDCSIKSYLYTATKNRALKHLRHEEVMRKNKGKIEDAIKVFNEAISIRKDSAESYNNLGTALKLKGNSKDAIKALFVLIKYKYFIK